MNIQIQIPRQLFERLQKHATPLVDTPATVIARWADYFDQTPQQIRNGSDNMQPPDHVRDGAREFDPTRPPDLFHTLVSGEFDGVRFSKWNDLMRIAHVRAFRKSESFESLRDVTQANIRRGSHNDSGYRYVPEIDLSIQNVDANHAWQHSLRLARYLGAPITVFVEWRHKQGAAFPGQRGALSWAPARSPAGK
jgi:hypothetical protein